MWRQCSVALIIPYNQFGDLNRTLIQTSIICSKIVLNNYKVVLNACIPGLNITVVLFILVITSCLTLRFFWRLYRIYHSSLSYSDIWLKTPNSWYLPLSNGLSYSSFVLLHFLSCSLSCLSSLYCCSSICCLLHLFKLWFWNFSIF